MKAGRKYKITKNTIAQVLKGNTYIAIKKITGDTVVIAKEKELPQNGIVPKFYVGDREYNPEHKDTLITFFKRQADCLYFMKE